MRSYKNQYVKFCFCRWFKSETKKELFTNYCAINLSHALLKSGITMNSYSGVKCWGCESIDKNSQHAIRAQERATWLKNSNIERVGKSSIFNR